MENNNFWWYLTPFCLGVASLTLTLYGYHERTSKQVVEEPAEVIKTVATEQKTEVPVGKIKCVHSDANNGICLEYVIYRTLGE